MTGARPRWTDEARRDLAAIIDYIASDNPSAADAMLDRIMEKSGTLPANPLAHRTGRLPGTREMVLHPNYVLIFAVTDRDITILRVLHSARNWP